MFNHPTRSAPHARIYSRALLALLLFGGAAATAKADMNCSMKFSMQGWSAIYKTAEGKGIVSCSDGTSLPVKLSATGGGLTVGKSSIDDGHGDFTGVKKITDVLGDYASGELHGGTVKSGSVTGLTKGEVSLGISGTGRGWDAGIAFSKFTIKPATAKD
jgi:hypothetical protein